MDVDKDPAMSPEAAMQLNTITVRRAVKRLLKAPASGPEIEYKGSIINRAQLKLGTILMTPGHSGPIVPSPNPTESHKRLL